MTRAKTWQLYLLTALLVTTLLGGCLSTPLRPDNPVRPTESSEQWIDGNKLSAINEKEAAEQARFDSLTDETFRRQISSSQILLHFSLKDPELFNITKCRQLYDDYTLAAQLEDMADCKELLKELNSIDSRQLRGEQRKTYFILQEYLKTELQSDGLELYNQPLSTTIGVQAQLPILLCEYSFDQKQDIENYLLLVAGIEEYYQQLLGFYRQKRDAGLMPSDRTLDHLISSCESYLLVPDDNFMVETFNTRLETVSGLSEEEKSAYCERNNQLLASAFVPAYQLLADGLTELKGSGTNEQGLSNYPDGKRYYEYLVNSGTGTSYTSMKALLTAMENQLSNDLTVVSDILTGYPELYDQFDNYSFQLSDPVEILEDLKIQIKQDFPELTECNYTIKYVPKALEQTLSPAFYLTPPIDDATNHSIYINNRSVSAEDGDSNLYTVLAHEGYPGHLYQSVYFNTTEAPKIRFLLPFEGYTEGWASYVERYSYHLDEKRNPLLADLIAANTFASLGLQAILDVYINYYGWDIKKVYEFLDEFYPDPDMDVVQSIYDAMVENPANYLSYYVGYIEIENMRQEAQNTLKDDFDLKEFHRFILDMGPAPFTVIRNYFASWLTTRQN